MFNIVELMGIKMFECPICGDLLEKWAFRECSRCGTFVCYTCTKLIEEEVVCLECIEEEEFE